MRGNGAGGKRLQTLLSKHSASQHRSLGHVKKPRVGHDSGSGIWEISPWTSLRGRQKGQDPQGTRSIVHLSVGVLDSSLPPTHSILLFFHCTTLMHMRQRENKVIPYPHEVLCVMVTLTEEKRWRRYEINSCDLGL